MTAGTLQTKVRKSVSYQQGDIHVKQQQQQQPNIYTDCQDFLVPDFDADEYAKSSIRKKTPAGSTARENENSESNLGISAETYADGADDIAASLARLSFSIDNLNKQLHAQVGSLCFLRFSVPLCVRYPSGCR